MSFWYLTMGERGVQSSSKECLPHPPCLILQAHLEFFTFQPQKKWVRKAHGPPPHRLLQISQSGSTACCPALSLHIRESPKSVPLPAPAASSCFSSRASELEGLPGSSSFLQICLCGINKTHVGAGVHHPHVYPPPPSVFKDQRRRGGGSRMGLPQINGYLKLKHMAQALHCAC